MGRYPLSPPVTQAVTEPDRRIRAKVARAACRDWRLPLNDTGDAKVAIGYRMNATYRVTRGPERNSGD